MKLSFLLAQRPALVRQVCLANLAFAHQTLGDFSRRIARARIAGRVRLEHAAPNDERFFATLTALDSHQSVIEEHFTDGDIMDLADVIAFLLGHDAVNLTFPIEDLAGKFLLEVRAELERAGVTFDVTAESIAQPRES